MVELELDRLLNAAKRDDDLKYKLIKTKSNEDPVAAFCELCQSLGYDIKAGELFTSGLEANDAKLRSVNGGGVNAIDGWDDTYEQFFLALEWSR